MQGKRIQSRILLLALLTGVLSTERVSAQQDENGPLRKAIMTEISGSQSPERLRGSVSPEAYEGDILSIEAVATEAEPDYVVELFDDVNGEFYSAGLIDFSYGDQLGCCGQNTTVGVIDSGIYPHSELSGNLLQGHNFINDTEDTSDYLGHGTFVAGLIAAQKNDTGIIGAAHMASVVPLKCFDPDYTTHVSTICSAIYAAVDVYHCQILNMSFGLKEYSSRLKAAIDYAAEKGVLLVASVGNSGDDTVYYPAAFENVIGVGAVDEAGNRASFSQQNESVFVVAPGVAITGPDNTGNYTEKSGTSFSAPIVTGIAARLMCADTSLNGIELMDFIRDGAVDLGEEGRDDLYGYGCVNLTRSLNLILHHSLVITGDVNGDGCVDAKDLTALARHVARIESLTDISEADIDRDGFINAADLTRLARYVAKIITTLDDTNTAKEGIPT